MSKTIGNYTWEDVTGITAAKDGTNIGIRCSTYYTFSSNNYGSCYAFFNISYTPLSNSKLRVKINSVQLRQDEWTSRNWSVSGSIKVNGATLFDGSITTPSGTAYTYNTDLTAGSSYYVDIDYPNSSGSLAINYTFSLYFKTDIYSDSWLGWTSTNESTCSTSYAYSHTHNLTSSVTKQPTCTDTGIRTYSCPNCEYSYTETISAIEHSYDSGVVTTAPTYEIVGVKTYTCSTCNETKTEMLDKLPATIYIDNGNGFDGYGIYIDDGSSWDAYAVYIDDSENFVAYC